MSLLPPPPSSRAASAADRFWLAWADFVVKHPWWLIAAATLVVAFFGVIALRAPKDLSLIGMLDKSNVEMQKYQQAVREFGSTSSLVVLLEGAPEDVEHVAERLEAELPARAPVREFTPPADPQWILDRAPWLWPDPLFDLVLNAVRSPASPAADRAAAAVERADSFIVGRVRPEPNALLLSMAFTSDIFDMALGGEDYRVVEREIDRIVAESGRSVEVGLTGIAAMGAQDQNNVFTRLKILTPITLVVVLLLLRGVEDRTSRILLAGLSLAGSVAVAFGAVSLVLGKLSITATFFGMLLLGLGIDFAIHLLVAMRDAHAEGRTPADSVREGIHRAGPAIVMGGTTTALAACVVAFVPQPGALDMGLTATFGLVASLLLMLSFLPAAWLLIERRHEHIDPPARFVLPGLHALVGFSIDRPRTVLFLTVGACAIGLAGLPKYHLERDLEKIMTRDVPAIEVERRIQSMLGGSPNFYLAPVDSLDEARRLAERFRAERDVGAVFSPADWVQPDEAERREEIRRVLQAAPTAETEPVRELRRRLALAEEIGPIELNDVPSALSGGTIGRSGELALRIVPAESLYNAGELAEQVERFRSIAPEITGVPPVALQLMSAQRDWVPLVVSAIFIVLLIVLTVSFRKPKDIFFALVPVMVGSLAALGIFFLAGFTFSILTGIVVPVILGLGVDDGIHVVERLRRYQRRDDASLHAAVEGVGRAIFLTSATTTLSFVGLFFSNHYGLESMAQFMTIGVPLCFVASVTVLPAVIKLMSKESVAPDRSEGAVAGE